jgi:hypothetical protein
MAVKGARTDWCPDWAGVYRVEFQYVESDGTVLPGEYNADIGPHCFDDQGPRVSQSKPYQGPLCVHDVAWLSAPPGKNYSYHRVYTVTPLTDEKPDQTGKAVSTTAKKG